MSKLTLQEYADKYGVFTTQDESGCRFSYEKEPKICNSTYWKDVKTGGDNYSYIKDITKETLPFDGDWKYSLCKPKKENEMELEVTKDYKDPKWCEVRDSEDGEWKKAILINDNSRFNIKFPYDVITAEDEELFLGGKTINTPCCYKYARPIPEKEYKPYFKFNSEWKGKKIKSKNFGIILEIIGTHYDYDNRETKICAKNADDEIFIISNKAMFEQYTWLDGSVCGEERKDGKI